MSAGLFDHHRKLLEDRAIAPAVIAARGYSSTTVPGWLREEGFSHAVSERVPGLVIPVRDVHGDLRFSQYRPDKPRMRDGKPAKYELPHRARLVLDVPPAVTARLASPARPLWITEGPLKADAAVSAGLDCIAMFGVWGWRGRNGRGGKTALACWEQIALAGRTVYLVPDSDTATNPKVADAIGRLGAMLASRDANVQYVYLPTASDGGKTGLDDWLAVHGPDVDGLLALASDEPPAPLRTDGVQGTPNISGTPPPRKAPAVPAMTMPQVEAVYARWLHDEDTVPTRVCHAVYAANVELDGDPVWVLLVGGSGWGKTERIVPLAVMPPVVCTSTVTGEAALLSATPRRDRAENATGGLLRRVGDLGILAVKDFTSILEMDRTDRGKVLAALREVYDGSWTRDVGTEGGQTLTWKGKCGFISGCTTAIDRAHSVLADMGPRSLFLRLPAANLATIAGAALDHSGGEAAMRKELADATAGILAHLPGSPHQITPAVRGGLVGLAILASQARSPVLRDWKGEIELVADAEAPTRIVKQLGQVWRACGLLGLPPDQSWEAVRRLALDSVPKLRGAVIRWLATPADDLPGTPRRANTTEVRIAVSHPHRTVLRALEDLAAHHVIDRISPGKGHADVWELSKAARSWMTGYEGVPEMLGHPCTPTVRNDEDTGQPEPPESWPEDTIGAKANTPDDDEFPF